MKPRFYRQETRYSCAPACLRMVLSAFGVDRSEEELRNLTDCTPFGTDAFQVVEAARALGLGSSRKCNLSSVTELEDLVREGPSPIVYVDLWPMKGGQAGQNHSLVILAVDPRQVSVLDPISGEQVYGHEDFDTAWAQMRRLTILIQP